MKILGIFIIYLTICIGATLFAKLLSFEKGWKEPILVGFGMTTVIIILFICIKYGLYLTKL